MTLVDAPIGFGTGLMFNYRPESVKKISVILPMSDELYREIQEDRERWAPDLAKLERLASGIRDDLMNDFRGEEESMPQKKQGKKKTNKARKKSSTKAAPAPIAATPVEEPASTLTYAKGWDDGAKRWKQLNAEAVAGSQDRHDALEGILELIAIAHRTGGIYTIANLIQKKKVEV